MVTFIAMTMLDGIPAGIFLLNVKKINFRSPLINYDRDVYGVDSSGGGNVTLSGGVDWDSYGYLTLRSSDLVSMFIMVRGKCTQMATLVGIHMMDIPTGG